jgi:putative CocE/NonD family hydrolase
MNPILRRIVVTVVAALLAGSVHAQTAPMTPDIPEKYQAPKPADYEKRTEMIPMRDGVKLKTVIFIPKGAKSAPILLERTPYNAGKRATTKAVHLTSVLPLGDELFVADGYIRVYQDVRGKHGSEGKYVMARPLCGPLNDTGVDHSTDAYDTIDWLVKNLHESNGKVGMIGNSYDGFTVVMAMINPHPALKAVAPESPMVDGWMGDDWFHYGAFRQVNFDYFMGQTTAKGEGTPLLHPGADDYDNFRRAGSAGDFAKMVGVGPLPFWHKLTEHPAYDAYWQEQALDKILARQPLKVPTLWVQGLFDQEDMWGAIHCYMATEPKDTENDKNFLLMGPWFHGGQNRDGTSLVALKFSGDTAAQARREIIKPFFDQYLKANGPRADLPPVYMYDVGANHWEKYAHWPLAGESGTDVKSRPLYLTANGGLSFEAPADAKGGEAYDEYVSDPAKPVPYVPRPVKPNDTDTWRTWLVTDQRFVEGRPDVLSYTTAPLTEPLKIAGVPVVHLTASTSGTDSDWVVKLIDVYPDEVPGQPGMGGYELPVRVDIFRGRYRESFEKPAALKANEPLRYEFALPTADHTFQPGHRIMVQVQSTLFPLYDRNPQTFVPNVFFAKPGDYVKATQRVYHAGGGERGSWVSLPVVEGGK